jgi:fatty-acyl-CoA synthase
MTDTAVPVFQQLWSRPQWPDLPVYRSVLSPLMLLERTLHVFPEKVGVVDGDRRVTYRELGQRVYRLASALRARGIGKGDRVALLLRNSLEMLEAHFAVPQLGAIMVPINVRLSSGEIQYILEHSGARALLLDTELASLVEPVRSQLPGLELIVDVDLAPRWREPSRPGAAGGRDYESLLQEGSPDPFVYPVDDEDQTISINYTSGTTGRPKGVMVTHRGGYLNALGELLESNLRSNGVYLWTLPMFHCNGWCFPWAVTGIGATHVCLPRVEPARVFELVEREGVTHLCGAPTVLIMLATDRPDPGFRFPRRLTIVTAAAPPPPAVIQAMEEMGAEIVHVYGLTEVYGPHTVCEWKDEWNALPADERARVKARQGVGYVHAPELRVVDEEMRDVPADGQTLGEVVMRGNNVMKGYYADPEATERAFRGGWFHSGDLAVLHGDGYVDLRDRAKDIIISGGENISTIEVERVLYLHPAVLEAAVIGVPDPKWGEVPKAFVTLKPGLEASSDDLVDFARQHLARFKVPRAIAFGPLPKTSTGKIQKFKLRDQEWAGHDKRIN